MKNASRKIITSVLTLVLTIVALGTTTFAWFSLSTVSNVSNIKGTVTAGDGLEVRLVGYYGLDNDDNPIEFSTPWKSNLLQSDVEDFISDIFASTFSAVTTEDLTSFTKAAIHETGVSVLGVAAVENEDYIHFTVEFRSQAEGTVSLTDLSFNDVLANNRTFKPDGTPYLQAPEVTGTHDVVTNAAYGARVAVGGTIFQYDGDEIELDNGEIVGNTEMGSEVVSHGQWSYLTVSKGIVYYESDGVTPATNKAPAFAETDVQNDAEAYRVSKTLQQTGGADYYEASMEVYIWIEGWDADTYDSIYEAVLNISLRFEKK